MIFVINWSSHLACEVIYTTIGVDAIVNLFSLAELPEMQEIIQVIREVFTLSCRINLFNSKQVALVVLLIRPSYLATGLPLIFWSTPSR